MSITNFNDGENGSFDICLILIKRVFKGGGDKWFWFELCEDYGAPVTSVVTQDYGPVSLDDVDHSHEKGV